MAAGSGDTSTARRRLRPLPLAATGRPAPFGLGAPAYVAALLGWLAAGVLLYAAAPQLVRLSVGAAKPVAAAHAIGVVFFPFAVAAAVWQLLPVMLRNDPPWPRLRWPALLLLGSGAPLAWALAEDRRAASGIAAALLGVGLLLVVAELVALIRGAPAGRRLVVSRPAVALAAAHAGAAFTLGAAVLADGGPEPLGVTYERLLLVHLSVALLGWLTVLIMAVGRTLVPMLALAAAPPPRRVPVPEVVLVVGLWLFVAGVAASTNVAILVGVIVMAGGLAVPAGRFARAATAKIGAREGPAAHVAVGLAFLLQAAALAASAAAGVVAGRRAAVACVLLIGIGWAVGVVVGHLGKLISLSAWGSWPPGPRPKQSALYPRRAWQVEIVVFALGVELLAGGVVVESETVARAGAALLAAAATVALASAAETVRRVSRSRLH